MIREEPRQPHLRPRHGRPGRGDGLVHRLGEGKHGGWSRRRRRIARLVPVAASVVVGIVVYRSDVQLRGTPLFEVAGPRAESGGRVWSIEVEHPGVEHTLMV